MIESNTYLTEPVRIFKKEIQKPSFDNCTRGEFHLTVLLSNEKSNKLQLLINNEVEQYKKFINDREKRDIFFHPSSHIKCYDNKGNIQKINTFLFMINDSKYMKQDSDNPAIIINKNGKNFTPIIWSNSLVRIAYELLLWHSDTNIHITARIKIIQFLDSPTYENILEFNQLYN